MKWKLSPACDGRGFEEEKKELNESFLGLENSCTVVAALNPANDGCGMEEEKKE